MLNAMNNIPKRTNILNLLDSTSSGDLPPHIFSAIFNRATAIFLKLKVLTNIKRDKPNIKTEKIKIISCSSITMLDGISNNIKTLPLIIERCFMMDSWEKSDGGNLTALCSRLVKALDESVDRNLTDGILLSGGLDTSILAYLASKRVKLKAFTAALQDAPAPDIEYATLVANHFGLKHIVHRFDEGELHDAIRVVVKAMDSFDPMEIRNSVTVYIALKCAKENGVNTVMTGDGCDELFAGYNFLYGLDKERLGLELQKLWKVMSFSSTRLADVLKMEVKLPYLDPEFKKFAMGLQYDLKVRDEGGQTWGKWILRKAFETLLPKEIVWRTKTPIESGSGTSVLPHLLNSKISNAEFEEKKSKYFDEDKVTIRDKEQLFYYEIYRSILGPPHPTYFKGKICSHCNSSVPSTSSYCRRCGGHLT